MCFFLAMSSANVTAQELNVNNIMILPANNGSINEIPEPHSSWNGWNERFYFPASFIYDHGLWVTGKRNGGYGWIPSLWGSSFSPGPIINGLPAMKVTPQDSARYRVYKVTVGETPDINQDIEAWPVDLGAPVDSSGKPKILGDQTAWSVFNGADTTLLYNNYFWNMKLSPRALLPIEVRETIFEHFGELNDTSLWANTVFFEWAVFNKGMDQLDSIYFTLWTDIDMDLIYSYGDDTPGMDTLTQTGYCWYNSDSSYAATGYSLLFGPAIPSNNDTAIFFGTKRAGYKNVTLSSFWGICDDSYSDSSLFGPPYSLGTAWNVVRGFMQNGSPIIDSSTHLPTKFPYAGDPITHTGSIWPIKSNGGGAGFMMTTGPVTMAPGDSQWIMIALLPSVKLNGVDAINRMRTNANYLRSLPYDSLVSRKPRRDIPIKPLPTFTSPITFKLYSNYPNPFNTGTIIPFDLPEESNVTVEVFDMLGRSVATLSNTIFTKGSQTIRWLPMITSGIYFVRINATSIESNSHWTGMNKVVFLK